MIGKQFQNLALAAMLAGTLISARPAAADDPPFSFDISSAGGGVNPSIHLQQKGEFVVITGLFTLNPGQQIDWHANPGIAIFVGLSGSATETDANGCEHQYGPGSALVETERDIHKIVNDSDSEPYVATGTFIVPVANLVGGIAGGLIHPVDPPPPSYTPCGPGNGH